jgi:hypothetical protein
MGYFCQLVRLLIAVLDFRRFLNNENRLGFKVFLKIFHTEPKHEKSCLFFAMSQPKYL